MAGDDHRTAPGRGLRWSRVDLDAGEIEIRTSYRLRKGVGTEKDTKTHQMRRIALDTETIGLLRDHRQRWRERLAELGLELSEDMYLFAAPRQMLPTTPYSPHGLSSRGPSPTDNQEEQRRSCAITR